MWWREERGVFKGGWRAGGNFVTFVCFSCTTRFIIDRAAPFLSMCELLITLWLFCHCSIPAKHQQCAPFWRVLNRAFLVGQHEPLGRGGKGMYCQASEKDLGQVTSPKMSTCIYVLSSQKNHLLGGISKSADGLSDVEENSRKWQLYAGWTVRRWHWIQLGTTGITQVTGEAEQKTEGHYRWGKLCIGKAAWFPAMGLNSGETVHGHDSQLQAGRWESSHCTAGREPAFTIPKCQVLSSLYRGTAPHPTDRDKSSSEEAQSSDFPRTPPVPPGSGPHHFVVVVGLGLFWL